MPLLFGFGLQNLRMPKTRTEAQKAYIAALNQSLSTNYEHKLDSDEYTVHLRDGAYRQVALVHPQTYDHEPEKFMVSF